MTKNILDTSDIICKMSKNKIDSIVDSEIIELFDNDKAKLLIFYTALKMPNWPKAVLNQKINMMYTLFEDFFRQIDCQVVDEYGSNIETEYLQGLGESPTRCINSQFHYSLEELGRWFLESAFGPLDKVNRNVQILKILRQKFAETSVKLYSPILLFAAFRKLIVCFYEELYINNKSLTDAKCNAREQQKYVISLGTSPYMDKIKKIFTEK